MKKTAAIQFGGDQIYRTLKMLFKHKIGIKTKYLI